MSAANFVEETAAAIGGTSGDGNVTLAAITGVPRFSSVFGTSSRMIDYVIQQTSTGKLERGMGYVAGNVLTRTKVKETWDGTNFYPYPGSLVVPIPIQFGTTPTAGDVVVRMAPLVDSFAPIVPAMQTSVGSPADGYRYSGHQTTGGNPAGSGTFGTTVEWYVPFKNIAKGVLTGIEVTVRTAGAVGSVIKSAIYEVGPNGLPGQCITQFNTIPAASTGTKQDTAPGAWSVPGPIPLPPGWYYIGFVASDTAVNIDSWGSGGIFEPSPLGRADGYGYAAAISKSQEVAGSLPTGVPVGTYSLYGQANFRNYGVRLKVSQ